MHTLLVAKLYLVSHEDDSKGVLDDLAALAKSRVTERLTLETCIDVFEHATNYGMEDIAERAGEVISQNIKLADPKRRRHRFTCRGNSCGLALPNNRF
jgi:transposase